MNLLDLVEMVCDWVAASQRKEGTDILKGMIINQKRFDIDDQLFCVIMNTVEYLIKHEEEGI